MAWEALGEPGLAADGGFAQEHVRRNGLGQQPGTAMPAGQRRGRRRCGLRHTPRGGGQVEVVAAACLPNAELVGVQVTDFEGHRLAGEGLTVALLEEENVPAVPDCR